MGRGWEGVGATGCEFADIKLGDSGNLEYIKGRVLDLELVPILYNGPGIADNRSYESVKASGGGSPLNFILS